jgi:hypothetical protein
MTEARTVLLIGAAAVAASALVVPLAPAQGPGGPSTPSVGNPDPPPPLPQSPRCIMRGPADCRLPDGRPDLTGLWTIGGPAINFASGASDITFGGRGNSFVGFEADGGLFRSTTVDSGDVNRPNFPHYKPEFWDKIIDLDYNGNFVDPEVHCLPHGVPRMGAPAQIIQLKDIPLILLFYSGGYTHDAVRQVWTDGRPHDPFNVAAETWNGDSVGKWEGDTLVIETIGFTDESWLHKNGYAHGFNLKVTERLSRRGNQLTWHAIVEDPEYLVEPWSLTPVVRFLYSAPNAKLIETPPCIERDRDHIVTHTRNG